MTEGLVKRIRRDNGKIWSWFDDLFMEKYAKFFGPTGIAVYMNLCRRVDKNQYCFPSEKTIAEDIGSTDRTVRIFLEALKDHRIITYKREKRKNNGRWGHNCYFLLDKPQWILPKAKITSGKRKRSKKRDLPEEIIRKNRRQSDPIKKIQNKNYFINKNPPKKKMTDLEKEIKTLANSKQIK